MLLLIVGNVISQMAGVYTVGGINPDFITVVDAVSALHSQGVSGSVVFNIRQGVYSGFTVNSIPNVSASDSIIFQSENGDTAEVKITSLNETVKLNYCEGVIVRNVTIEATGLGTSANSAIYFWEGKRCSIKNCRISTPNSSGQTSSQSAIDIRHGWGLPNSSIVVSDCDLIGNGCGFNIVGDFGKTLLYRNSVISNGRYSLYVMHTKGLEVERNLLNGEIYVWNTLGQIFNYNDVVGDILVTQFDTIKGNAFNAQSSIRFDGKYFEGNSFDTTFQTIGIINSVFRDNYFVGGSRFNFCDGLALYGNHFLRSVEITQSPGAVLGMNECNGSVWIALSNNSIVYDNLFYSYLELANSWVSEVVYNNFSSVGYLLSQGVPVTARYNNFSQNAYVPSSSIVEYNNYYPSGGSFDGHPFFYNPDYIDTNNIRAQNLLLAGKAYPVPYVLFDIDSVNRPLLPTIGANEVCMQMSGIRDTIDIVCGDEIKLSFCNADNSYKWRPTYNLKDSMSSITFASPTKNTTYYLIDSTNKPVDSVYVFVNGFVPQINMLVTVDGLDVTFVSETVCTDSLFWNYGDSHTNTTPNYDTSMYHYSSTGTYSGFVVACNNYGCDTFFFTVNPVGISDVSHEMLVSAFPNPFLDLISLKVVNAEDNLYSATLFDIYGNAVVKSWCDIKGETLYNTITTENISNGVYFLVVEAGGKRWGKCMIKGE